MKVHLVLIIATAIFSLSLKAQSTSTVQTTEHPTITYFRVGYKGAPTPANNTAPPFSVFAMPVATVNLNPSSHVSKVYFKLIDPATDSVLYSVNYNLSEAPVINPAGITLFNKTNNTITWSTGQVRLLKPYYYRLQTEDSLQALSPLFLKLQ